MTAPGVGCACGWPLEPCSPKFAEGMPCDRERQEKTGQAPGEAEREARDRADWDEWPQWYRDGDGGTREQWRALAYVWNRRCAEARGVGEREEREKTVAEMLEALRRYYHDTPPIRESPLEYMRARFSSSVALPEQSEREET